MVHIVSKWTKKIMVWKNHEMFRDHKKVVKGWNYESFVMTQMNFLPLKSRLVITSRDSAIMAQDSNDDNNYSKKIKIESLNCIYIIFG